MRESGINEKFRPNYFFRIQNENKIFSFSQNLSVKCLDFFFKIPNFGRERFQIPILEGLFFF